MTVEIIEIFWIDLKIIIQVKMNNVLEIFDFNGFIY